MKSALDSLSQQLQTIADEQDVLILSFVAPDKTVKVSPVGVMYASIDIDDLYEIEKVVENLEEQDKLPKRLHLVVQTPGGLVSVSTKIANYLRDTFEEITAFVPYEASSGGTVLCLAANQIVMGKMANLTPIDPQLPYDGTRVSAASFQRTVTELEKRFGKKRPVEIPPPYQQMCEKLDPVIITEMNKIWIDSASVASDLLTKSYRPSDAEEDKITRTALTLTYNEGPHGHIINAAEAKSIGLRVDESTEGKILLQTYKKWVKSMLGEEQITHIIRHYHPSRGGKDAKAAKPAASESKPKQARTDLVNDKQGE